VFVPIATEVADAAALLSDSINGDALGQALVVTKLDDAGEVVLQGAAGPSDDGRATDEDVHIPESSIEILADLLGECLISVSRDQKDAGLRDVLLLTLPNYGIPHADSKLLGRAGNEDLVPLLQAQQDDGIDGGILELLMHIPVS
jgi:hypothetical protein